MHPGQQKQLVFSRDQLATANIGQLEALPHVTFFKYLAALNPLSLRNLMTDRSDESLTISLKTNKEHGEE